MAEGPSTRGSREYYVSPVSEICLSEVFFLEESDIKVRFYHVMIAEPLNRTDVPSTTTSTTPALIGTILDQPMWEENSKL